MSSFLDKIKVAISDSAERDRHYPDSLNCIAENTSEAPNFWTRKMKECVFEMQMTYLPYCIFSEACESFRDAKMMAYSDYFDDEKQI